MKERTLRKCLPEFSDQQVRFLEMIELGFTFPEAMHIVGINSGHVGAWKRWTPRFSAVLGQSHRMGIGLRRRLRFIARRPRQYGNQNDLPKELEAAIDARESARARLRAAARASERGGL